MGFSFLTQFCILYWLFFVYLLYKNILMRLDLENEVLQEKQIDILTELNTKTINMLVNHFYNQEKIAEKEYTKWLLDEKGTFVPKLKDDK